MVADEAVETWPSSLARVLVHATWPLGHENGHCDVLAYQMACYTGVFGASR